MLNKSTIIKNSLIYLFLTIGAVIMVFPFIWMILCSFKTHVEIIQTPPKFFPANFSFDNYKKAFSMAPFGKYFINSLIVMVANTVLTAVTTILGAFAFSRLKFPGKEIVFSLLLSLMMIPFEMLIIKNYQTIVKMHLYNTLPGLIIPFISSIFYTYILKNFFDTVPDSLYYSARIDGASKMQQIRYVTIPGMTATLVIMLILDIGKLLTIGYEKVILLQGTNSDVLFETAETISTYVWHMNLGTGVNKAAGAAADMLNSVISMLLVIGSNQIARKVSSTSLY